MVISLSRDLAALRDSYADLFDSVPLCMPASKSVEESWKSSLTRS